MPPASRTAPLNMKQVGNLMFVPLSNCQFDNYWIAFAVCETIYHENEVDDDVANCVTEMICQDPDVEDCEEEEKIPKRSCDVGQATNKKVEFPL